MENDNMTWFKCGKVEIGLKELGLNSENRMVINYIVKLNGTQIFKGNDLSSGCNLYRGLKDMGNTLLGFLVYGDFLDKEVKQELEDSLELDFNDTEENSYLLEEV